MLYARRNEGAEIRGFRRTAQPEGIDQPERLAALPQLKSGGGLEDAGAAVTGLATIQAPCVRPLLNGLVWLP
jgi:hypothetical protein